MRFGFGSFELDARRLLLCRDGVPVHLEPKVFDVLAFLLTHHDRVVTKNELLDALWPDETVTPAVVATAIAGARRVLGQQRGEWEPIQTLHGRGYRIAVPVSVREDSSAPAASTAPPPEPGRLIGRDDALASLRASLTQAFDRQPGFCLVAGEAGLGKTRLLEVFAGECESQGAQVWSGRAREHGSRPFQTWLPILRAALTALPPGHVSQLLGGAASDVASLLPEMAHRLQAPGQESVRHRALYDAGRQARRLHDALARVLIEAARHRPSLILLHDLQWAEGQSLQLLVYLLEHAQSVPLLVVAASRYTSLPDGPPSAATARRLFSPQRAPQIVLRELGAGDVHTYVTDALGAAEADAHAAHVHNVTRGNPLFVEQLTEWLRDTLGARPVRWPDNLRALVRERLRGLDAAGRELLSVAAVFGGEISLGQLQATLNADENERHELYSHLARLVADEDGSHRLGELLGARKSRLREQLTQPPLTALLEAVPGHHDRFRFRHALLREAVYYDLSESERAELHLRVGEAMARSDYDDEPLPACEIASHFERALPTATRGRPVEFARRAAEEALCHYGPERAAAHAERALSMLELQVGDAGAHDARDRGEIMLLAATAHSACWDPSHLEWSMQHTRKARSRYQDLVEHARRHELPVLMARGALGQAAAAPMAPLLDPVALRALLRKTDPSLRPTLEGALATLPDSEHGLRARVLIHLATTEADGRMRRERTREALRLAEQAGDPDCAIDVLTVAIHEYGGADGLDERLRLGAELLAQSRRAARPLRIWQAHMELLHACMRAGRMADADQHLSAMAKLADEERHPHMGLYVMNARIARAVGDGRLDDAEREVPAYAVQSERRLLALPKLRSGITLFLTLIQREGAERLDDAVDAFFEQFRFVEALMLPAKALTRAGAGRHGEARELMSRFDVDAIEASTEELKPTLWAFTAWAAVESGFDGLSRVLLDNLEPYADQVIVTPLDHYLGSCALFLGQLHAQLGQEQAAVARLEQAMAHNRAIGAEAWTGRSELALADAIDARDPRRARELRESALARCERLGIGAVARRARAALDRDSVRAAG